MKNRIKRWIIYKLKRTYIRAKLSFRSTLRSLNSQTRLELNDIQKPLYDICMRLIQDPKSQLRSSPIDYVFQIESEKYLIIIRPSSTTSELYSVSLVEYKEDTRDLSGFVEIPFPVEFVKIIIHRFEKEVQKRMKYRQVVKVTKVSKHLKEILNEMD